MMSDKEKAERFFQLWAATFKNLTEKDGRMFWTEFIQKSDWERLEEAVGLLADKRQAAADSGYAANSPKLPEFKRMYFDLKNRDDRKKYNETTAECFRCKNSGWLRIVKYHDGKQWHICDPRKAFPAPPQSLGIFAGPCACDAGDYREPYKHREQCTQYNFGPGDGGTGDEGTFIKKCYQLYNEEQAAAAV